MGKARRKSQCPQCKDYLGRHIEVLRKHFLTEHNRLPTSGEEHQFINFTGNSVPYADGEFIKPKSEVSGGRVSPK